MGDDRIVDWAPRSQHILLRCKKCGAKFHTKNLMFIGARTIFVEPGHVNECLTCDDLGHTIDDLEVVPQEEQ